MSENVLKEETVALALRALYRKYGYRPYKMSKFEEYDLYARNKEFLEGERIVTFNDTDGKLLALKPDITLSIVKNDADDGAKRKVYYNENVYRASKRTGSFKELQQIGLECIGEIDLYDVYESVYLAAASLNEISERFVLDISHVGVLSAVFEEIGGGKAFEKEAKRCLAEKNLHELTSLCQQYGVEGKKLETLLGAYGEPDKVLKQLKTVCKRTEAKRALGDLETLWSLLKNTQFADRIRFDFSVTGGGNYYDDVVFKGFIDGIGDSVLSGGRYDRLLARMGKQAGAIGFAVYLDLLEGFDKARKTETVDVVVLYDDTTPVAQVIETVNKLIAEGDTVCAQKSKGDLRCKRYVDLTGGKKC